jgi:hypothetical protein
VKLRDIFDPAVGLDEAYRRLNDPKRFSTPQSVIEAVMYCVRERGLAALEEPANVQRLRTFDDRAKAQLNERIEKSQALIPKKDCGHG